VYNDWVTEGGCELPARLLIANGENVKVVQELMRHASTRFTIEVYTQARIEASGRLSSG